MPSRLCVASVAVCGTYRTVSELTTLSFDSRSHDAVIRVYDAAANVIETYEHRGDFKEF